MRVSFANPTSEGLWLLEAEDQCLSMLRPGSSLHVIRHIIDDNLWYRLFRYIKIKYHLDTRYIDISDAISFFAIYFSIRSNLYYYILLLYIYIYIWHFIMFQFRRLAPRCGRRGAAQTHLVTATPQIFGAEAAAWLSCLSGDVCGFSLSFWESKIVVFYRFLTFKFDLFALYFDIDWSIHADLSGHFKPSQNLIVSVVDPTSLKKWTKKPTNHILMGHENAMNAKIHIDSQWRKYLLGSATHKCP